MVRLKAIDDAPEKQVLYNRPINKRGKVGWTHFHLRKVLVYKIHKCIYVTCPHLITKILLGYVTALSALASQSINITERCPLRRRKMSDRFNDGSACAKLEMKSAILVLSTYRIVHSGKTRRRILRLPRSPQYEIIAAKHVHNMMIIDDC